MRVLRRKVRGVGSQLLTVRVDGFPLAGLYSLMARRRGKYVRVYVPGDGEQPYILVKGNRVHLYYDYG